MQVNNLVMTRFGYGNLVQVPQVIIPQTESKCSLGSVQEGQLQPIDNSEIQVKLKRIESQQKQQQEEDDDKQDDSGVQSAIQSAPESAPQSEPPSLADPQQDSANVVPKLVTQSNVKSIESPEDQLPFPNMGVVVVEERKAPFIVQLSSKLGEAIEKTLQIRQSRQVSDDRIVQVKLKCDAMMYAPMSDVSTFVYVIVKTFYGNRNYYCVCVPIATQLKQVIRLLSESSCENPKLLYNIRLIYTMGGLLELKDHNLTIADYGLKDMSQLLMFSQVSFHWDSNYKGKAIALSNNNCTATKTGESDYQTVLGTLAMSQGRHYWEIKVEKFVDEEDLFVGIARKEIDLYSQPTTTGMFWAYVCLCAHRVGPDGQVLKYGYLVKQNDTIGVLLEFNGGVGTLSFYSNGSKCGEAFNGLTGTFYPAVSMFYGEVQVSLDPKAAFPIN